MLLLHAMTQQTEHQTMNCLRQPNNIINHYRIKVDILYTDPAPNRLEKLLTKWRIYILQLHMPILAHLLVSNDSGSSVGHRSNP